MPRELVSRKAGLGGLKSEGKLNSRTCKWLPEFAGRTGLAVNAEVDASAVAMLLSLFSLSLRDEKASTKLAKLADFGVFGAETLKSADGTSSVEPAGPAEGGGDG